ncbi:hypothetical protein C1645_836822 [Glomus cerebriforme]|uniref:DUF659 domain-containing protein n=1 Tax=Glomus cerebriforme TaxID=658196 RepID=A0A397S577_9GLOM|nr:hypothetical protein C1645_836822 [Glomus cerebriforme]
MKQQHEIIIPPKPGRSSSVAESKKLVVKVDFLDIVNNVTIGQLIIRTLTEWSIPFSFPRLLASDSAAYMKKSYREVLKPIMPQLIHSPCLAHILNLIINGVQNPTNVPLLLLLAGALGLKWLFMWNEFNELNFPEIKQSFANLTELVFTTDERKDEIFSLLSQTCNNIQKMIMRVKYQVFVGNEIAIDRSKNNTLEEAKQVASLIRSQHNLIYFTHQEEYFQNLQELRFIKCIYYRSAWRVKKIDYEKRNDYKEGLWLLNLKFLKVDINKYKEDYDKIYSILLGCSLINEI